MTDKELPQPDPETPAPQKEKKGIFVKRDIKGYVRFFAAMLIVAVIVVCIFTLLPKKNPRLRSDGDNGLGRSFMYPFVFTDEKNGLYVLGGSDKTALPIDDTVSDAVHVTGTGSVLYVRDNELYEYDISAERRRPLASGVKQFSMTGDRTLTVISGTDNSLKVIKGKQVTELAAPSETVPDNYYVTGNAGLLFLKDIDQEAGTATLTLYTSGGAERPVAENISYYQPYGFSAKDKYIYCHRGQSLLILDNKGGVVSEISGGSPVDVTKQATIYENPTKQRKFNSNAAISYIYVENVSGSYGSLMYFNGKSVKTVAEEIKRVIYAASEHGLIIYTVPEGNGERICRADGKGKVEKLIYVEGIQRSLYDSETNYLYYQLAEGALYRVNIYSTGLKPVLISEISSNIYKYLEKPFVLFTLPESDMIALIGNGNAVEQYNMNEQIRLYGADVDKYLLLRSYGYGGISLDLADSGYFKRISSSVESTIIFDSLINNVLFVSEGKLCVWSDGKSREAGNFSQIVPVDLA